MDRQKQIEVTDEILSQITAVTKTTVDPDNIVVFEAAALSTKALHKPGSLYHEARPSRSLLVDAAEALNAGTESVPLHTLHMQGEQIPVGRVFRASVHDEVDGSSTLRAMFYLPTSERDLISKINLGVLDEVSVGLKSTQAFCSKCGFDYFGPDADFTHLFSRSCDKNHVLGEDGAHLKMVGLDKWMELSLVSRGASNNAKILSRAKQILPAAEYDRLAASGKPVEALFLYTSTAMENPMPKNENPEEQFDAQASFTALTEKVDELIAKFDADAAAAAAAEAAAAEEETLADVQAQLAAANERITELETAKTAEEEAEAKNKTPANIPPGGVAASAIADASKKQPQPLQASAFKTKQRR